MAQEPSWTDVYSVYLTLASLIVSFLSLVAAGIGAWKLLARDKQRESEVDALIHLAKQSQNIFELESNKTKPRFVMETHVVEEGVIRMVIRNVGGTATILLLSAEITDFLDKDGLIRNRTVANHEPVVIALKLTKPETSERLHTEEIFVLHFTDVFGNVYYQAGHIFYLDEIVVQPILSEPKVFDEKNPPPTFEI